MTAIAQHIVDGLGSGSLYVLLALGFTLIFGVMGIMNVAHADLYMLAVFSYIWIGDDAHLGRIVGFLAGTGAALAAGYLVYLIVLRRIDRAETVAVFVGTLGVSYVIENVVAQIVHFNDHAVPPLFATHLWRVGGVRVLESNVVVLTATLVMGVGLLVWLKSSSTGRLLRAVSESPANARIVGIDTSRITGLAIVIASLIAGVGGLLVGNQTQGIDPFVANTVSLKMFAVAVVAGVGSVGGAIVVGFGLGVVEAFTVAYFGSTWENVIGLAAMILVLLFRPQGLFGRYQRVG